MESVLEGTVQDPVAPIAYLRAYVFCSFLAPVTACPTTFLWLLCCVGGACVVQIHKDWLTSIHRHNCQITVIRLGSPACYHLSLQQFIVQTAIFSKDWALHLVSDGKKRVFPIRGLARVIGAVCESIAIHLLVFCCIADMH
jgi:hypothetical protein